MIIDGKKIAQQIQEEIKLSLEQYRGQRCPCLAVILVGDHPASRLYIERKTQACKEVGIKSIEFKLPANASEKTLVEKIIELNQNPDVDGILVQLPLPSQINSSAVIEAISPDKDIDGFHPVNVGKMLIGEENGFLPCTPLGIRTLLERSQIPVAGRHVLIVGRSNIVGKPMAAILMQNNQLGNATVTIAHSKTHELSSLTQVADIIILAMGRPQFLKESMIKNGAVVIDVGINRVENSHRSSGYSLVGDADFDQIKDKCSFITPVPGGVGPMTIAMLLSNTCKSFIQRVSLFVFLVIFLTACSSPLSKKVTSFSGMEMTIDYHILVGHLLIPEQKNRIIKIIRETFDEVNRVYNKWNPDSELTRLNNLKANVRVRLSPELEKLLLLTDEIVHLTEGRFDPTIEPLQLLWKKNLAQSKTPSFDEIESMADTLGWHKVHIQEGYFYKELDGIKLDLGGIAKGYCVDLLIKRMNHAGFENVFVEWGGEIRATGRHPEGRPWNIFISRLGNPNPQDAITTLSLTNEAIATSGDYVQNWTIETPSKKLTYFHIIDPFTLEPRVATLNGVASASVLAPTCALADGLATAAMMFSSLKEVEVWADKVKSQYPEITFWIISRDALF